MSGEDDFEGRSWGMYVCKKGEGEGEGEGMCTFSFIHHRPVRGIASLSGSIPYFVGCM